MTDEPVRATAVIAVSVEEWDAVKAEIQWLKAQDIDHYTANIVELQEENERLRAESEAFRGKLAEQCGQTLAARAESERLWATLQRIDGINDNPACFNPMIEEVLRATMRGTP